MTTSLRPNTYAILSRAVEEGAKFGYLRAFKYTETPSEDMILESIHREIMNAITEVFVFDGEAES